MHLIQNIYYICSHYNGLVNGWQYLPAHNYTVCLAWPPATLDRNKWTSQTVACRQQCYYTAIMPLYSRHSCSWLRCSASVSVNRQSAPEHSSSVPEYSSSALEYSSFAPEYSSFAPEYSSSAPEYSSSGPEYTYMSLNIIRKWEVSHVTKENHT